VNLVQFQGRILAHAHEALRQAEEAKKLSNIMYDLLVDWNKIAPEDLEIDPLVLYGLSEVEAPRAVSQDQPALPGL